VKVVPPQNPPTSADVPLNDPAMSTVGAPALRATEPVASEIATKRSSTFKNPRFTTPA
jgi:hypothetical protein